MFETINPAKPSDGTKPDLNTKKLIFEPGTTELWISYCGECELTDKSSLFSSKVTPNPVYANAVAEMFLPVNAFVSVKLMTASGEHISTIKEQHFAAGNHIVNLHTASLSGGTYLLKVQFMHDQMQHSQVHKIIKL